MDPLVRPSKEVKDGPAHPALRRLPARPARRGYLQVL